MDYVLDPDLGSIEHHYSRSDREYHLVSLSTFQRWSQEDHWVEERDQFYNKAVDRAIEKRVETVAEVMERELEELTEAASYLREYMMPLKDENGRVKRHPKTRVVEDVKNGVRKEEPHPFAGKPIYPIHPKTLEGAVKAHMAIDPSLHLRRDKPTARTETTSHNTHEVSIIPDKAFKEIPKEMLREMSQALVRLRQPELAEQPILDVKVLVEGEHKEEDDTI